MPTSISNCNQEEGGNTVTGACEEEDDGSGDQGRCPKDDTAELHCRETAMVNLRYKTGRVSRGWYPRYIPARGQFSLNRRTKTSNFSDVGQTLVSNGISTKISTSPVTLNKHTLVS